MLARSFDKATLIESEQFPAEHGPFDVVIANWVLHFIDEREQYLEDIKQSLPGKIRSGPGPEARRYWDMPPPVCATYYPQWNTLKTFR